MANTIATSELAIPFLLELEANMVVLSNGNNQFNKNYTAGAGDTIYALVSGYGKDVTTGGDLSGVGALSDVTTAKVPIKLEWYSKGFELTLLEDALKVQNKKESIDMPFASKMASDIQKIAIDELYMNAGNVDVISTIQLNPSATADKTGYLDISKGIAKLHTARSTGAKCGIMSPEMATIVMNSGLNFFQADTKDEWVNGKLGTFRGVKFYETPDISGYFTTVAGAMTSPVVKAGTSLVDGATTFNITGTVGAAGSWKKGAVITVAGVNSVDVYGNDTGKPFPIVLQANATLAADFAIVFRGLFAEGAAKNVTALPAANAAITVLHAASKSYHKILIWDKQAFVVAGAKLAPSDDAKSTVTVNGKVTGLTMSTGGDFLKAKNYVRYDILIGFKQIYQNLVSRIDVVTA